MITIGNRLRNHNRVKTDYPSLEKFLKKDKIKRSEGEKKVLNYLSCLNFFFYYLFFYQFSCFFNFDYLY